MEILLVCATKEEGKFLQEEIEFKEKKGILKSSFDKLSISLVFTGIGMVNTAYTLGKHLALNDVDYVVNFGICGSFKKDFQIGDVVEISREVYGDLGAEDDNEFLSLEKMGFVNFSINGKPFYNECPPNEIQNHPLPSTLGITVNKVHGSSNSINKIVKRLNPDVESMESAAIFQICHLNQIPFICIRGISNYVEVRNRANWNIPLALKNCQRELINYIKRLPK